MIVLESLFVGACVTSYTGSKESQVLWVRVQVEVTQ